MPTNTATNQPRLYGVTHSNRLNSELWGKNQFNSTFPAALACYMRDENVPAVFIAVKDSLEVECSDLPVSEVFNSTLPNDQLRFDFEAKYHPYQQYAMDNIGAIDLVVKHHGDDTVTGWRRPLEVKLTVCPDLTTSKLQPTNWSPELVIRPASTKYCALGISHSLRGQRAETRAIFQDFCGNFAQWNSTHELTAKREQLLIALRLFLETFHSSQKPFLLQPIWKTEGVSPSLANQAFDIFVWSDFALCSALLKQAEASTKVTRFTRAAARLARMLYLLSTQDQANLSQVYTEMPYGLQTDKEFALSGHKTKLFLKSPRRLTPALPREALTKLILGGGENLLSPERRFDATIFFTTRTLFEEASIVETIASTTSIS